jgi:hypothetical protein
LLESNNFSVGRSRSPVKTFTQYFASSAKDYSAYLGINSLGWTHQGKLKRAIHRVF